MSTLTLGSRVTQINAVCRNLLFFFMLDTQEQKVAALAHAINAGELERVRELVETHGCHVHGPGPWNQLPLAHAAESGHIHIIDYLVGTRLGALVDESTLRAAIRGGKREVVEYLLDHYDELRWTAREYELAFASYHPEMVKLAFQWATDEFDFHPRCFSDQDRDAAPRVLAAAREAILQGMCVAQDIFDIIRKKRAGGIFYVEYDSADYGFLFRILESAPSLFPAVWELAHDSLFEGKRYKELDGYCARNVVDDLFAAAIRSRNNAAFFTLLQYALPRFSDAISLARDSDNPEISEYLQMYGT